MFIEELTQLKKFYEPDKEKLIEHLNKIDSEKTTLLSELERYKQLALVREQELKSCKDDLICSQIDYKNIIKELTELKRTSSITKEHNYKLRKKIEELEELIEKLSKNSKHSLILKRRK